MPPLTAPLLALEMSACAWSNAMGLRPRRLLKVDDDNYLSDKCHVCQWYYQITVVRWKLWTVVFWSFCYAGSRWVWSDASTDIFSRCRKVVSSRQICSPCQCWHNSYSHQLEWSDEHDLSVEWVPITHFNSKLHISGVTTWLSDWYSDFFCLSFLNFSFSYLIIFILMSCGRLSICLHVKYLHIVSSHIYHNSVSFHICCFLAS